MRITLRPKAAEVTTTLLAVCKGIRHGLADGVLRITEMRGAEPAEALGLLQRALAARAAGGGIGGSWHVFEAMTGLLL